MKTVGLIWPSPVDELPQVIGYVLDGIKGVACPGLTHHMKVGKTAGCLECVDRDCGIAGQFVKLLSDERPWFVALSEACGAEILIAAEGSRNAFDIVDDEPNEVIVCYQNPLEWAATIIRAERNPIVTPGDLEDYAGRWSSWYADHLRWLEAEKIPFGTLDLDVWRGSPEASLKSLCWFIGSEYNTSALKWHSGEHHKLGGTISIARNAAPAEGFDPAMDYQRAFTTDAVMAIASLPEVTSAYRKLVGKKINR
jgi:hypothetical protein